MKNKIIQLQPYQFEDISTKLLIIQFIDDNKNSYAKYIDQTNKALFTYIVNTYPASDKTKRPNGQKIYNFVHNIDTLPLCDMCNTLPKSFISYFRGYTEYCGIRCASNSPKTKASRDESNLKKYGTTNPASLDIVKNKRRQTNTIKYYA